MKEKKKLLTEQERIGKLESHVVVIRGLMNYHKRMVAPLKDSPCAGEEICPVIKFENDLYLEALEESLRLLEGELLKCRG